MTKLIILTMAFALGFAISLNAYADFEIGQTTKVRCTVCEKVKLPD